MRYLSFLNSTLQTHRMGEGGILLLQLTAGNIFLNNINRNIRDVDFFEESPQFVN